MLPGSLNAGRSALLNTTRATSAVRTVPSTNVMTALFTAACRAQRVVSMWQKRAAGRHVLARLDDHLLQDIGLTREAVQRDLMKPFWRE